MYNQSGKKRIALFRVEAGSSGSGHQKQDSQHEISEKPGGFVIKQRIKIKKPGQAGSSSSHNN